MKSRIFHLLAVAVFGLAIVCASSSCVSAQSDPLPSWNDTPAKQAIIQFAGRVTMASSADFVAPPDRIATFDNDGTLWVEQPMHVQQLFALDRVKAIWRISFRDAAASCVGSGDFFISRRHVKPTELNRQLEPTARRTMVSARSPVGQDAYRQCCCKAGMRP